MEKTHYIYRITHLPTGRFYIGKRSCNGPWQEDRYMGSGKVMKRLLKKYPRDQFKKEVLCLCRDAAQALYAERAALGTQWRDNPFCINLREGGDGVVAFWDLPENREAQSERTKKRFEDPANREVHSDAQKKRFEDPEQRAVLSEKAKKRLEDPAARAAHAERVKKAWANPKVREVQAAVQKKRWADPVQREAHSASRKKHFENPVNLAAHSAAQIKDTVRLSKDGVIYKVNKALLLSELVSGASFISKMTKLHHPVEDVCLTAASGTAKHLLLLDCGWEFGKRSLLEQITIKHVDKATGKVLPRS